ncbi:MAG: hypothetical protein KDC48_21215 [Planctomycetes bacterium]|nr:hypothetical protein [Planctomycetota bacterium]
MRSGFVAALLLVGVAAAQAREPAQAPVEVGRTFALGGTCRKILIAADQRHALTVGSHGDLCWWDLERREVLRHVAPRERYVAQVALHPVRGMLAVSWTDGTSGAGSPGVVVVDLETGAAVEWSPGKFDKRQFDAAGRRLAADSVADAAAAQEVMGLDVAALLPDSDATEPPLGVDVSFVHDFYAARPATARSFNGEHEASIAGKYSLTCKLSLDGKAFVLPCPETWLEHFCVTDDGLAIADDQQGQVHFVTPDGTMQLRAPHRGDALRLVFSPDSRHVAVHGLGAVRIVALAGTEELRLQGSHVALPGEAGGEFRIFERHRTWRFDAGSRREVGETATWQEPSIPMLSSRPVSIYRAFATTGLSSPWRTAVTAMIDGAPWFVGSAPTNKTYRWQGDGWTVTEQAGVMSEGALLLHAHGDGALLVCSRTNPSDDRTSSQVQELDAAGRKTWQWSTSGHCEWAVPDTGRARLWLGHGSEVLSIDLTERSVASHRTERTWLAADLLPDGSPFGSALLASDGAGLLLFDPDTFEERHRWPNPDGWQSIDVLAVAPDGRHVAIAHRDDVRILRLP